MTGLGYNSFAKRELKWRRRQQMTAGLVGLLLVASLTGWWDYTRTKVSYYAQLTQSFGTPVGVVRFKNNEQQHRETSYRVESSRHKVRTGLAGKTRRVHSGMMTVISTPPFVRSAIIQTARCNKFRSLIKITA